MKTKADVLSVKEETFCQLIASGKCKDQSDAWRRAFRPKKMAPATIHTRACELRGKSKIQARIKELMQPVIDEVRVTRGEWLKKMENYFHADVRKMFDGPGNVKDLHALDEPEAMMVEGFELVENFAKVGDHAEHVGYTKKVKLTPKLKAMLEFGKVMGWCEGEDGANQQTPPVVLQINFVNGPKAPMVVASSPSAQVTLPRVKFVHGNGNGAH